MPIWLNIILGFVVQAIALFSTAYILFSLKFTKNDNLFTFIIIAGSFTSVLLFRYIFRKYVPAKCPECGGKTYCKGSRPMFYKCADCNHIHETNVYEGKKRTW